MRHSIPEKLIHIINAIIICFCANAFLLLKTQRLPLPVFLVLLISSNLLPLYSTTCFPSKKIWLCNHGAQCLRLFLLSIAVSIAYHVIWGHQILPEELRTFLSSILLCFIVESILFWNGMISVYSTSVQLGIRHRVLGIVFGFFPVVNLILLVRIIHIAGEECSFETEKNADSGRGE